MDRPSFQKLRVYCLPEQISDKLWSLVMKWPLLAKDTVGKQMVRAADSIGANIAEGSGRGSFQDNRRFVKIARGSLNETVHFLRRADVRGLISAEQSKELKPLVEELGPKLNAYLKSIGPVRNNGQRTTDN
jgi:four helix bundle protein